MLLHSRHESPASVVRIAVVAVSNVLLSVSVAVEVALHSAHSACIDRYYWRGRHCHIHWCCCYDNKGAVGPLGLEAYSCPCY